MGTDSFRGFITWCTRPRWHQTDCNTDTLSESTPRIHIWMRNITLSQAILWTNITNSNRLSSKHAQRKILHLLLLQNHHLFFWSINEKMMGFLTEFRLVAHHYCLLLSPWDSAHAQILLWCPRNSSHCEGKCLEPQHTSDSSAFKQDWHTLSTHTKQITEGIFFFSQQSLITFNNLLPFKSFWSTSHCSCLFSLRTPQSKPYKETG